jgi:hypothetical protein
MTTSEQQECGGLSPLLDKSETRSAMGEFVQENSVGRCPKARPTLKGENRPCADGLTTVLFEQFLHCNPHRAVPIVSLLAESEFPGIGAGFFIG